MLNPNDLQRLVDIINVWLNTPMTEARYIRRLAKIRALESHSER